MASCWSGVMNNFSGYGDDRLLPDPCTGAGRGHVSDFSPDFADERSG
ncbi:Uncharacterised protein [Vibrio cholerae]|nr:Uncharacterised protein [Vibrio cholerae]